MYRTMMEELKKWRTLPDRSPLILRGARQVGKAYLVRELGREYFENTVFSSQDRLFFLYRRK